MAELIFVFAHAVSKPKTFHLTSEATAAIITRIDTPREEASPFPSESPCRVRESPTQQILFVAGSKRMIENTRGIEREIWDQQWSYGEFIFSTIVKRIGLNRFSPRAPTSLTAHLVGTMDTPALTRSDLGGVAHQVARECLSILRLKKEANQISRVIVVLPVESGNAEGCTEGATVATVKEVLQSRWLEVAGPLQGLPMKVEVVVSHT
mmetsp:Transcript_791/g.1249  ORF Transcript_791/g.1249 Transcript_791/m.1249 type:complete len:208 (-) Transcript_791:95-718(-)